MQRVQTVGWCLMPLAVLLVPGCSLAPKNFRAMLHPAPIVRARAVGLEDKQPEAVAIPALIGRLNDPDDVVRMTAGDALKERAHQDFGYKSWAKPEERQPAIDRWRAWWAERAGQAAYPKDDELRKVAAQPVRKRRKRRLDGGQGGPTAWPDPLKAPQVPQPSNDPTLAPAG